MTVHEVAFTNGYPRPCRYDGQGVVWSGSTTDLPPYPMWRPVVERVRIPGSRPLGYKAILGGHECIDCGLIVKNYDT